MLRPIFYIAMLSALGACGGSSSDSSVTTGPDVDFTSDDAPIDVLRDEAERLGAVIEQADVTVGSAIPMTGAARYSGIVAIGFLVESANGIGLGGDVAVEYAFADDSFSVEMDNFYSRDGDARAGQLSGNDGVMIRTDEGALFSATLSGDLDVLGSVSGEGIALDGAILGSFAGDDAEYIGGAIELVHQVPLSGTDDTADMTFEGGFLAERD